MIADKSQDGFIFPRIIDHPPKSGGHRVALSFLQGFDFLNRGRLQRTALFPKAIADEQQTSRRVIGFGLDFCVCGSADGRFVIAEHHFPMPQEKVVSDLMSLKPSMLGDRGAIIDKNPSLVWQIQRTKVELFDSVPKQAGPRQELLPCALQSADRGTKQAVLLSGEIRQVPASAIPGHPRVSKGVPDYPVP